MRILKTKKKRKRVYLKTLSVKEIIQRLKKGEVVRCESDPAYDKDECIFFMVNNIIVQKGLCGGFIIGSSIFCDEDCNFYFDKKRKGDIT